MARVSCVAQMALLQRRRRRRYKPRPSLFALQQFKADPMSHSIAAPAGGSVAADGNGDAPAKAGSGRSPSAASASSTAISAPARSTRCAKRYSAAVGSGNPASEPVVLGILSLIIWALLLVVTAKYVLILLRADNNGEGGTLALMALASRAARRRGGIVILLGIISGALFYGDAIITPALSVLSAVEGLKVVTPAFDAYVVPLTVVILVALFAVQSRGTAKVAASSARSRWSGSPPSPLPASGMSSANPDVLLAFNPVYGVNFLLHHGVIGFYHARRRLPGRDRRGSALCRSWPFRPRRRSALPGLSWCCRR